MGLCFLILGRPFGLCYVVFITGICRSVFAVSYAKKKNRVTSLRLGPGIDAAKRQRMKNWKETGVGGGGGDPTQFQVAVNAEAPR